MRELRKVPEWKMFAKHAVSTSKKSQKLANHYYRVIRERLTLEQRVELATHWANVVSGSTSGLRGFIKQIGD